MIYYFVDGLLEEHLVSSLGRALERRGHEVRWTGRVWQGATAPVDVQDQDRLAEVCREIVAARADVVLVFRPVALAPELVELLSRSGAKTIAWFADDPVFYAAHSRDLAASYDITLHTGTAGILAMYERDTGARGWNFPFWADQRDFPLHSGERETEADLVFIGNMQTRVKAWRYDWLVGLREAGVDVRVFGKVAADPAGLGVRDISDTRELAAEVSRARFGINISQRFGDYRGSALDYPGLSALGEFSLPSRVVQLAAVGVPIIALCGTDTGAADMRRLFPPAVVARSQGDVVECLRSTGPDERSVLAAASHEWFRRHFTPDSRAAFLDWLVLGPEQLDVEGRAEKFLTFDGGVPGTGAEDRRAPTRRHEPRLPMPGSRRSSVIQRVGMILKTRAKNRWGDDREA